MLKFHTSIIIMENYTTKLCGSERMWECMVREHGSSPHSIREIPGLSPLRITHHENHWCDLTIYPERKTHHIIIQCVL